MSVAATAMTMDQRPLNNYDKMSKSKQYEHNLHNNSATIIVGGGGIGIGGGGGSIGAPPSGPASPTNSEEPPALLLPPPQQQHHMPHHHPHHHHHHHPQQQASVAEAVAAAEQRQRLLEDEIESLKLEQTRLSQQSTDAQRREKILIRRLANKEQEFQDYVTQIAEYKAAQAPSALALRSALLDPAVNLLFEKLKKELKATKAKLEETQNELSAWKFTPDSNTGKRLMAKCRLLYQENEELGKMTSNGRLAKLETELAMQKSFSEEVKKSQSELDDFLQELDEDVEGMQSTILFLQQELKTNRDRIQVLERENCQLKSGGGVAAIIIPTGSITSSNSNDTIKDIDEENTTISISTTHIGLNGTMPLYNSNSNTNNLQQQTVATNSMNDMKFQTKMSLETIDENACLRTSSHLVATTTTTAPIVSNDFFGSNGGNDDKTIINSTIITAGKLRTVASRKRNFDCIDAAETPAAITATTINTPTTPALIPVIPITATVIAPTTAVAPPPPHIITPRTLPPKKSKLRRSSVLSAEINEYESVTIAPIAAGNVGVGILPNILHNAAAAVDPLSIVDNAVVGMANEEITPTVLLIDDAAPAAVVPAEIVNVVSGGGVAQRIMTRRRSLRTQQNGNSLGGSDSNH